MLFQTGMAVGRNTVRKYPQSITLELSRIPPMSSKPSTKPHPSANQPAAYGEASIRVLKGLEPVKQRPGMYTRTDNPLHIIQEVLDNAADEALAGYGKKIKVILHLDGSVSIEDDGRGIPFGLHPEEKAPVIELVFTRDPVTLAQWIITDDLGNKTTRTGYRAMSPIERYRSLNQITADHILRRVSDFEVRRLSNLLVYLQPGELLAAERGELPWRQPGFEQYWRRARADSFLLHP